MTTISSLIADSFRAALAQRTEDTDLEHLIDAAAANAAQSITGYPVVALIEIAASLEAGISVSWVSDHHYVTLNALTEEGARDIASLLGADEPVPETRDGRSWIGTSVKHGTASVYVSGPHIRVACESCGAKDAA